MRPALLVAIMLAVSVAFSAGVQTDATGRIAALSLSGEPVAIRTNLRVPTAGWKRLPGLEHARDVEARHADGRHTWTGVIALEPGRSYRYQQTLVEGDGALRLELRVTALADVKTEGVYFWLSLPVARFGGGTCQLSKGPDVRSVPLPSSRPPKRHLAFADADRLAFAGPDGTPILNATLDPACRVGVQDNREWNAATYSAYCRFAGQLTKGQTAELTVRLSLSGEPDRTPVALTLDPASRRYRFDGFGGNYCFGIESPVTQYTLDHLRVAWARTEMSCHEWEPTNENRSPEHTDWQALARRARPGTNLRREFALAQQVQRRGIPLAIAVWHLPEWLYAKPRSDGKRPNRRRLAPGKWPELLECIGSYLLYAKREYGVEPDLFSFNEPGIGVRVKFTAQEHRQVILRLGAHFAKLGLRTKMILGDVTRPKVAHDYVLPAARDSEAMGHVGALGFHSWGGASAEQYAKWGDLADRLKLPLLVTELGVDPFAWRGRAYDSFAYGLREVRMVQEILLHARPRATMQWEFTSDYGTVRVEEREDGEPKLVPTRRFWFLKHFCNLTPPDSEALGTRSDHPQVLFTAFAGRERERPAYTLHIASLGAARPAVIAGIPAWIKSLRAVRTSAEGSFKNLPPVPVADGTAKLSLAAQSLLTLTTLPE